MAIEGADLIKAAAFLGAGLSMGLGAIGPGVGEGMAAAKACEAIGKNPKESRVAHPYNAGRPGFIRVDGHLFIGYSSVAPVCRIDNHTDNKYGSC